METQQMIDQLNDIHKGLAGVGCLSNEAYQYFSEKLIRVKEALAKNLPQAAVSGSLPPLVREGFTQAINGEELWINTTVDEMITVVIKDRKLRWDFYCKQVKVTVDVIERNGGGNDR